MSKKVALFAFNGEVMCFVHVLLNALEMQEKQYDVKLIIEGSATQLIRTLATPDAPFAELYAAVKQAGLIDAVCQACSAKMGTLEAAQLQGLPLSREMKGHPSLSRYLEAGYEVLIF
ncbi:cytoplasmic protein [candidate division KSB3 bacterium]|uniref:Cytoplasmic protein n=1 Tax=candidate division KSB3 bacterium TaxID=2044937 RepID=A0A9D5JTH3_9BACT|nr:cytoplasmic protein [candidate division KSB3 bacterium]MBD3323964.1 cytoplasmic protein [candidate division KSB3 bacterium]